MSLPRGKPVPTRSPCPRGLILRILTALALLPGAAPPISSEVYACVSIYIKAVTLKDAGSLSEETNPLKHDQ